MSQFSKGKVTELCVLFSLRLLSETYSTKNSARYDHKCM